MEQTEYKLGDLVIHKKYGSGKIISLNYTIPKTYYDFLVEFDFSHYDLDNGNNIDNGFTALGKDGYCKWCKYDEVTIIKKNQIINSYNYEVICKNALIEQLKKLYNEDFKIEDLHLVWFSKILQNYKCVIVDLRANQRYYEITFNGNKNEIYIDIYQKEHNIVVSNENFNDEVN